MAKIWIKNRQNRTPTDLRLIKRIVKKTLEELALKNPEISILLLDDHQIQELNRDYLRRNRPTDVIAFPMRDAAFPEVQPQLLGGVVVSLETAARQARENNISLYEELMLLLIHGILHLLGYDHERSLRGAQRMRALERRLRTRLLEDEHLRKAVMRSA